MTNTGDYSDVVAEWDEYESTDLDQQVKVTDDHHGREEN